MRILRRPPRWIFPAVWAAFILSMATDLGSGENTGALLDPFFAWFGIGPSGAAFVHGAFRALGHVSAYAAFALLVHWAARPQHPRPVALALLLAVGLAIVDETLQGLVVPTRTGDVADVLLDGGAAALALLWASRRAQTRAATESAVPGP